MISSVALHRFNGNARRHVAFITLILASVLVFWRLMDNLVAYSLKNESNSHIILIPLVSFFLLYIERKRIFSVTSTRPTSGIGLAIVGLLSGGLIMAIAVSVSGF